MIPISIEIENLIHPVQFREDEYINESGLQNDSDEQFTDMKFMFSRYELKTINKRLVRGRNQSASEGKFMGSMAPYGYRTAY